MSHDANLRRIFGLSAIALSICVIVIFWPVLLANVTSSHGNDPGGPWFTGYRSEVMRINQADLDELIHSALQAGLEVNHGFPDDNDEYFEIPSFLGGGRFYMRYGSGTDSTHYHYKYLSNETGRLNQFWERFGYYFNISEFWVEKEKDSIRLDDDAGGKHLGSSYDKKPVWSRVMADCGDETERDETRVGMVLLEFSSGAEFTLRTDYIQIVNETIVEDVEVRIRVIIDGDSDIEFFIDCEEQISDPAGVFTRILTTIGLPKSLVDEVDFEERYAYAI